MENLTTNLFSPTPQQLICGADIVHGGLFNEDVGVFLFLKENELRVTNYNDIEKTFALSAFELCLYRIVASEARVGTSSTGKYHKLIGENSTPCSHSGQRRRTSVGTQVAISRISDKPLSAFCKKCFCIKN